MKTHCVKQTPPLPTSLKHEHVRKMEAREANALLYVLSYAYKD